MTPRARRWLGIAAAGALLLILGRRLVEFLVPAWWLAALSPAAAATARRWRWLELALTAATTLAALAWMACHAALIRRTRSRVHQQRRLAGLVVHDLLPLRWVTLAAVILTLAVASGSTAWTARVALAWHGVHYGMSDPVLGRDLGWYLSTLPLWDLAHHAALVVVVITLIVVAACHVIIDAVTITARRVVLHSDAQRHLGALLVLLAVVIGWGYLLEPYHLVVEQATTLGAAALNVRVLAAWALTGATLAVAIMTGRWALRSRHALLLAGWTVLLLAGMAERIIVPVVVAAGTRDANDADAHRRMSERLYHIAPVTDRDDSSSSAGRDIWDAEALQRIMPANGERLLHASPLSGATPAWQTAVLRQEQEGVVAIQSIAGDSVAPTGAPIPVGPPHLVTAISYPGATGWRASANGVASRSWFRRAAMAWALQQPGLLTSDVAAIDWQRDPITRLAAAAPHLTWRLVGVVASGQETAWLALGAATAVRAPYSVTTAFAGRIVQAATPAAIATVRLSDGHIEAWQDPVADPLGRAWAALYRPLVAESPPPADLLTAVSYDPDWFAAQVSVLEAVESERGRRVVGLSRVATDRIDGTPGVTALLEAPHGEQSQPRTLISARRVAGQLEFAVRPLPADAGAGASSLTARWQSDKLMAQLRDSLHAVGDSLRAGPLHQRLAGGQLERWRLYSSMGQSGPARALWLAVARGEVTGGDRRPGRAWRAASVDGQAQPTIDAAARLEVLRGWIRRGDSALARRDITAFGRTWEALRGLILPDEDQ